MAKSENKTQPTKLDPKHFIATVEHDRRRSDAEYLLDMFTRITGMEPVMWGPSLIGYGRYHYKYDSGREGDFFLTGFSPRKQNLSIHIMPGYQSEAMQEKLRRLGKHKMGKSCLYINKLADVDLEVLEELIRQGVQYMQENYPTWDK